jgi:hypothetical protein
VTGGVAVRHTKGVGDELLRLFDSLLDRANALEDFDTAQTAIDAITREVEGRLARSPLIYPVSAGRYGFLKDRNAAVADHRREASERQLSRGELALSSFKRDQSADHFSRGTGNTHSPYLFGLARLRK